MRRAAALRVIGQVLTASFFAGCGNKLTCSQYPVPASTGSPATPTRFGSQIYASDDLERVLGLLAGCGGTMVRIEIADNLPFSDAVLAAAAARGIRVILLSPRMPQPVNVESYAQTCAALQVRYAAYDPVWEIWNEPNLGQYWLGTPDVDDYSRLALAAGKALRAAGARDVWSGGTSGAAVTWNERLRSNGVFDVLNGCAVHFYDPACESFNEYLYLRARLPGIQFHTTETCVPSSSQGRPADQAGFLREMWYIHRMLGIPTMVWCEFRDGTAGHSGSFAYPYGLVDANYTRKESYFTARDLIAAA